LFTKSTKSTKNKAGEWEDLFKNLP